LSPRATALQLNESRADSPDCHSGLCEVGP
jgi:hypothetical protein